MIARIGLLIRTIARRPIATFVAIFVGLICWAAFAGSPMAVNLADIDSVIGVDAMIAPASDPDGTTPAETRKRSRERAPIAQKGSQASAFNQVTPTLPPVAAATGTQLAMVIPDTLRADHGASLDGLDDANQELLAYHYALLKGGRERFSHQPGYTAILEKQERIGSTLSELVSLRVKVRHDPFSVYLKWLSGDPGKELLYVDGTNDGQLLVRLGGLKGRILPALRIDPLGSRAMKESRYPITKLGILALADSVLERREQEIRDHVIPKVRREPDVDCEGRRCAVFVFEVSEQEKSPVYRKSVQFIDREWNVPIQVANYTWSEADEHLSGAALDDATLIEYYKYSEIEADAQLTDRDFDRANSEYRFHR